MVSERVRSFAHPWAGYITIACVVCFGAGVYYGSFALIAWSVIGLVLSLIYGYQHTPILVAMKKFDETGNRVCPECLCDLRSLPASGNCPQCNEPYTQELLDRARELLDELVEETRRRGSG